MPNDALWLGEALLATLAIVLPCLCLRRWSGGRIAVTCWAVLLWIVTWKAWVEGWGSDALAISTLAAVVSLTRLNVAPPTAEATK